MRNLSRSPRVLAPLAVLLGLSGCAGAPGVAASRADAALVQGPPISDIVTPFDEALMCLKGKVAPNLVFAVGAVADQTGKESLTDGGVGKFVTQGAGDMVQSALFKAGTTVVNRRDPRVTTVEAEWQIRDVRRLVPANFYITGSINSLDFIPGSGAEVEVAGIGGRYRQNRILIGLDVSLTEATSGRIVANVPLHKQIFSSESGVGTGRFFGDTLVGGDIGFREREAIHFALRQMLYLATFDLLTQVMKPGSYSDCRAHIDAMHGSLEATGTARASALAAAAAVRPATTVATRAPGTPPPSQASAVRRAAGATSPGAAPSPAATPASTAAAPESRGSFAPSNGGDESQTQRARAQAVLGN